MMFVAYAGVVIIAAITVFTVCRLIDHVLAVREERVHSVYTAGLLKTASEEINWLSDEVIEKMNSQLAKMLSINEES